MGAARGSNGWLVAQRGRQAAARSALPDHMGQIAEHPRTGKQLDSAPD